MKLNNGILKKRKPTAWACRVCNKIDWNDTKEPLAKPNHIPYRGVDIGECKGKMIPLVEEERIDVKDVD